MSQALTRYTAGTAALSTIPAVRITTLADLITLGQVLAASRYFKDATTEQQAVAKILYGAELGIGPMAALQGIYFFDGSLTLSATLMAALIKKSGRYNYRVGTWTAKVCEIHFTENGQPCGTATFTVEEAKHLLGKNNWQNYPKAMLWSRAMSQGARAFCPDVFEGGVYTPEEMDAPVEVDPATGEILVVAVEPPTNGHAPTDPDFAALGDAHPAPAPPAEAFVLAGPTPPAPLPNSRLTQNSFDRPKKATLPGPAVRRGELIDAVRAAGKAAGKKKDWLAETFHGVESVERLTDAELERALALLTPEPVAV